jgi:hypothetical protein
MRLTGAALMDAALGPGEAVDDDPLSRADANRERASLTAPTPKPGALALQYLRDRDATLRGDVLRVADHPARAWWMAQLGLASRALADLCELMTECDALREHARALAWVVEDAANALGDPVTEARAERIQSYLRAAHDAWEEWEKGATSERP